MVKTIPELKSIFVPGYSPTSQDITDLIDTMQAKAGPIPLGAIVRAGSTAPLGTLRCDGALLSTTTYADLYAAIGEQFSYRSNNGKPWEQQYDINYTQSGAVTGWSTANTLPTALAHCQAVVTKNRVYLMGGTNGTTPNNLVHTAVINGDGTLGAWSAATALPGVLGFSSAIVTNNRVHLMGGATGSAVLNIVYTAPINADGTIGTWTLGGNLPGTLASSCAIVTNSRVYLLGGRATTGTAPTNVVYTAPINADGTLGTWTTGTALPLATVRSQAFVTKNRVYITGGADTTNSVSNVYTAPINSDGTLGAWVAGPSLVLPTQSHSVIVTNSTAYMFGGYQTAAGVTGKVYYASINPDGTISAWAESLTSTFHTTTGPKRDSAAFITNGRIHLAGGNNTTSGVHSAPLLGGLNDYSTKSYVAVPGTGQFRLPDLTQDDLRRPNIYSYIKY